MLLIELDWHAIPWLPAADQQSLARKAFAKALACGRFNRRRNGRRNS